MFLIYPTHSSFFTKPFQQNKRRCAVEKLKELRYQFKYERVAIGDGRKKEEFQFVYLVAPWRTIALFIDQGKTDGKLPPVIIKELKRAEEAARRQSANNPDANYFFGYLTTRSADAALNEQASKIIGNYLVEKYRCRGTLLLVPEELFSRRLAEVDPRTIAEKN